MTKMSDAGQLYEVKQIIETELQDIRYTHIYIFRNIRSNFRSQKYQKVMQHNKFMIKNEPMMRSFQSFISRNRVGTFVNYTLFYSPALG